MNYPFSFNFAYNNVRPLAQHSKFSISDNDRDAIAHRRSGAGANAVAELRGSDNRLLRLSSGVGQ